MAYNKFVSSKNIAHGLTSLRKRKNKSKMLPGSFDNASVIYLFEITTRIFMNISHYINLNSHLT